MSEQLSLAPSGTTKTRLPAQTRWSTRVSLGARIRNVRVSAGLSQSALAEGLISAAYLSCIEAGERRPSTLLLDGLASRLGTSSTDLTRGDPVAAEGLRFELAHADLLLAWGRHEDASRVAVDLIEVATCLGSSEITAAARIVQASSLAEQGQVRAALRIVHPMHGGASALPAMVATAKFRLKRNDFLGVIEVGHRAAERIGAQERISFPVAARLASTLCRAYEAVGRVSAASRVAELALQHLPTETELSGGDSAPSGAPLAVSYRNLEQAVREIERAVATFQLTQLRADIADLQGFASLAGGPKFLARYAPGQVSVR